MRLLIIGDLNGQLTKAAGYAAKSGASVRNITTIDQAMEALRNGGGADLIMIDAKANIASLFAALNQEHIYIPIVACGFDNDAKAAADSIKAGAKEYLPLPPNAELIAAVLEAVVAKDPGVTSLNPEMRRIYEIADQISGSSASVLITGESGTGKEIMARYIHNKSNRSVRDMIAINLAAVPENLIESELFGHEKGAFTGAVARRIGKFEEANGSSLLLDEISEMDVRLQAKLLRALQEREISRVGDSKTISVDIRVLATSNRDLKKEVDLGNFRQDLYFRLNVINLHLPPLRERKEDIPQLAQHFIVKYAGSNGARERELSRNAVLALQVHDWPGNIRELENTIYRAVLLAKGEYIEPTDLMLTSAAKIHDGEQKMIMNTLNYCLGDQTKTANILGISLKLLQEKLAELEA